MFLFAFHGVTLINQHLCYELLIFSNIHDVVNKYNRITFIVLEMAIFMSTYTYAMRT